MHILNRLISEEIDRNCEPDDIVTDFSKFITDRANIYFENRSATRQNQAFINTNYKEKKNVRENMKITKLCFIIIII